MQKLQQDRLSYRFLSWVEKNREKLWFSILLNFVLWLFWILVFRPSYETNDDNGILCIVNGSKGVFDPHLIQVHPLVGLILSFLYQMRQSIPWYALFQYFLLFWAFTALTFVLIRILSNKSSIWITLIVLFWFTFEAYVKVQFTKTAGILSASGLLLLFYATRKEKISWGALAGGIVLGAFGFMYRDTQFFAEAALMTAIGLFLVLRLPEVEKGRRLRRFLAYIAPFALILLVIGGLYAFKSYMYRDEVWQEYFRYDDVRTELFDYGFPSYSEHRKQYKSLGIDRIAYKMLKSWNHVDTEKFPTEVLEEIASWKEPAALDKTFFRKFFSIFPKEFFSVTSFYCFLLVFVYWLFWGVHNRSSVVAFLYEGILTCLLYMYLYHMGRYLINRVDVGIWLAVSLTVLWTYTAGKAYFSHRMGAVLLLTVVVITQRLWSGRWRINLHGADEGLLAERARIEEIRTDTDHLYFASTAYISLDNAFGIFDSIPFGMQENICPLGGWTSMSDIYMDCLEKWGIENPFRDMIGNDKVYLIDRDIDTTMKYLHKYYDKGAQYELVKEIGRYKVYRILAGSQEQ